MYHKNDQSTKYKVSDNSSYYVDVSTYFTDNNDRNIMVWNEVDKQKNLTTTHSSTFAISIAA